MRKTRILYIHTNLCVIRDKRNTKVYIIIQLGLIVTYFHKIVDL